MTNTDHAAYIAHLKTLDAAWLGALRAAGFKKPASQLVHKASGVRASRVGFENGYLHLFNGRSVYAETVEQVEAVAAEVVELTRG